MAELDTAAERDKAAEAVRTYHRCGFVGDMEHAAATVPAMADEIDRLRAENQRIGEERDSLASSLAIETGKYRDAWAENQRLEALIIHDAGGRAVTQGSFNAFMDDYNRVREQRDNARSRLAIGAIKYQDMRNEIESVLQLMDGLAEQWGDEAVFRRCRDRLRALTKEAGE